MRPIPLVTAVLTLTMMAPLRAEAREKTSASVESQLSFGVKMARQALWSEALFRFQEAAKIEPENPRVLSNLGVAFEATGRFEAALESYQKALKVAPNDKDIRNNYARFVEFYQGFKGEKGAKPAGAADWKPTASKKGPRPPEPPGSRDPSFPSDLPPSPPGDEPPPPADN